MSPLEHCAVCDEVIFFWKGAWVHGTDHVAVPASRSEIDATLILEPTKEDPDEQR